MTSQAESRYCSSPADRREHDRQRYAVRDCSGACWDDPVGEESVAVGRWGYVTNPIVYRSRIDGQYHRARACSQTRALNPGRKDCADQAVQAERAADPAYKGVGPGGKVSRSASWPDCEDNTRFPNSWTLCYLQNCALTSERKEAYILHLV